MGIRLNVGCGATPTPGWVNIDNSVTVRIARIPGAVSALHRLRLISPEQAQFGRVARRDGILWADVSRSLPFPTGSADVIYSSHMLEHLERAAARHFLREAHRTLRTGGILRLALPDLARIVDRYNETGDADSFVAGTALAVDTGSSPRSKLRFRLFGHRQHAWMYDATSIARLLIDVGFDHVTALPSGETTIPNPGALDLREREAESLYVEAVRPS